MTEGSGAVARGDERAHQGRGNPAIQRIEGCQFAPPSGGGPVFPLAVRPGSKLLQQLGVLLIQTLPFALDPALEFAGARQVKSVEKRTGIQVGRPTPVPVPAGGGEFVEIAGNDGGVEPELLGAEEQLFAAQALAQGVQRLTERAAGPLLFGVGPEESEQALARDPAISGSGQECKQGQPPGLGRLPRQQARSIPCGQTT